VLACAEAIVVKERLEMIVLMRLEELEVAKHQEMRLLLLHLEDEEQ
jgi:hypothetical protein